MKAFDSKPKMWQACKEEQECIRTMRQDLHRIPELDTDLPKTQAYITGLLAKWGIPFVRSETDSGILASICGAKPGRTVMLRADMDALPIAEETGVPFASDHAGQMHACGHDAHVAMLLGAAKVLQSNREQLSGTVKLLFQTAEETGRGALVAIENGWLDQADVIFGQHIGSLIDPAAPAGTVFATKGCCMASFGKFTVCVRGSGCHGSTPEKGIDPINIAAHIVLALEVLPAREFSAHVPVVLTIGSIHGGGAYNVIPDTVELTGTIRCVDERVRQHLTSRMETLVHDTASAFGGSAELTWAFCSPPVMNDPDMAELVASAADEIVGKDLVVRQVAAPSMGGEDFAFYLQQKPGAFFFLSSANPALGTDVPHHNAHFNIDESVLWQGAALFVSITERYLRQTIAVK